jgi:hypothetical protein
MAAAGSVTRLDRGPDRRRTVGRVIADRTESGDVEPAIRESRRTDPAQDPGDLRIRCGLSRC